MFLLVILGWVRFRSESLGQAVSLYAAMAGLNGLYGGANGVLCLGAVVVVSR